MHDPMKQGVAQESMAIVPDDYLTPEEVAKRLRVAKSALYERLGRGDIPNVRFGRSIRVREADVARYLSHHRRERPSKDVCQQ